MTANRFLTMKRLRLILWMFCCLAQIAMAQGIRTEKSSAGVVAGPSHHLGVDASFNANDVLLGAIFYYANPFGEGFSLVGAFTARPYGKKMLVQDSPGTYLYLREERYSLLIGIDRQLALTPQFGLFASLLGGVTIPVYRGSERNETDAMFPVVSVGLQWSLPSGALFADDAVAIRLGGEYLDLLENKYRIYSSILVSL